MRHEVKKEYYCKKIMLCIKKIKQHEISSQFTKTQKKDKEEKQYWGKLKGWGRLNF